MLCSGASARQLKAITSRIRRDLRDRGIPRLSMDGDPNSGWVLADYFDVVVHIFTHEARSFYQLEMLWGDAPRVPLQ